MNILVVDDHATNRKLLRAVLESENQTVFDAADGVEALGVLKSKPVDAVISDILMPRMDGYRLCHEVRSDQKLRDLPFIVYTSTYSSPADEKLSLDLGADKFIVKPAPNDVILSALHEVLKAPHKAKHVPPLEADILKEYNERLVAKLEQRNAELEIAEEKLRNQNAELERRVQQRTEQLEAMNKELTAFSHSVAHDLQAPLRAISGYSEIVIEDCAERLTKEGNLHLRFIKDSADRMRQLIQDLLGLSHVGYHELISKEIDLSSLANEIIQSLRSSAPDHKVNVSIAPDVIAHCDRVLMRVALDNLLKNSWKFTGKTAHPKIQFGALKKKAEVVYFVRDNGAGFDMEYAGKLFGAFQRLHTEDEFTGTGIGLATVQRIIHRHSGRIWAESAPDKGATFYFTLPRPTA